jgi:phosphatidylserine/phosphatidylglycerophosphate/cardiolipin synthase-like enzyme
MTTIKNMVLVLNLIGDNWIDYNTIKKKSDVADLLLVTLSNLEKVGFIEKESNNLLSENSWKITKEGKVFLNLFNREMQELIDKPNSEIIMTIPQKIYQEFIKSHPPITSTADSYERLFSNAKKTIKILNPYIDASITSFLDKINKNVTIEIITISGKFSRTNPILERQKSIRDIHIKYLDEFENGTQIFQLHAKLVIVDSNLIYVGSANFKETSLLHNLEAGITSKEKEIIQRYEEIFDFIYKNYAR